MPESNSTSSFWLEHSIDERLQVPVENIDSPLPQEIVDVVILGGGLTGVSTAFWCQQHGLSSVVLEARCLSGGATGRNGGHLCPDLSNAFEAQAVEELVECISSHSIKCDLVNGGMLELHMAADELPTQKLDDDASAEHWDSARVQGQMHACAGVFRGGVFNPTAWQFWPAKLVFGLAKLAIEHGCKVFERVQAFSISKGEDIRINVLTTSRGDIRAKNVVVALNGFCSTVLPSISEAIFPCKNQVLVSKPVPAMWRCGFSVGDGSKEIYALQRPDGRIIVGGCRAEAPNEAKHDSNDTGRDALHPRVSCMLRTFLTNSFDRSIEVDNEWAGVLGFTKDGMPIVGLLPESVHDGARVFIGAGYCGHGMPYCFAVGKHLAELMTSSAVSHPYLNNFSPTAPGRVLFE